MKKFLSISLLTLLVFTLTACGSKSEKDRFVNASVEVGCAMFQDENFFQDFAKVEEKTKDVFAKYGFDVENEEQMSVVSQKFQQDEDVLKRVQEGIMKCAGNIFNKDLLNNVDVEAAAAKLQAEADAVTKTETAVEAETKAE